MCNGNLGMYRVMPWAYPTIQGQSAGGVSVDPTPEPTPEPQYFDFSGATVKFSSKTSNLVLTGVHGEKGYPNVRYFADVAGVTVIDNSSVSKISMEIVQNTLTVSPTTADGFTLDSSKNKILVVFSGINFNGSMIVRVFFYYNPETTIPYTGKTKITLSGTLKVKLKAFDASGNMLQESQEITVT